MPNHYRAIIATLLVLATTAYADTYTFTGRGNWSLPGNWLNGLVPQNDAATQVILDPTLFEVTSIPDASRAAWTLNTLIFKHTSGGDDTLAIAAGSSLAFTGPNPSITNLSFASRTITGTISSDAALALQSVASSDIVTLAGNISAPSLHVSGGAFSLSGANTFTNGITVDLDSSHPFASLSLASPGALGSGPLTANLAISGPFLPPFSLRITPASGTSTTFLSPLVLNGGDMPVHPSATIDFRFTSNHTFYFPSLTVTGNVYLSTTATAAGSAYVDFATLTLNGNTRLDGNFVRNNISGAGLLTLSGYVTLPASNSYTGGTTIRGGVVSANDAHALGTGPVSLVLSAALKLNAFHAAAGPITGTGNSIIAYLADAAASGHLVSGPEIHIGPSVASLGGDTFAISPRGYFALNSGNLPLFLRGQNLTLASGTTIEFADKLVPNASNLGAAADLTLALHTSTPLTVAIGAGTPWGAFSNAKLPGFVGTLAPSSDFSLAGGTFGLPGINTFNISGPTAVHVDINRNALFKSTGGDFSGVADFRISATLELAAFYNFSTPNAPTLSGDGTIIVDSTSNLTLPLDAPFTGTIQVNGSLTLTPPHNPAITAPSFTIIGAYTIALPTPEPASLSLLALAAPLLLRRKR
jgi:hypothetical protein